MSKPKVRLPKAPPTLTRKHLARVERERILQRWMIGVVGVIVVAVLGLMAYPLVVRTFIEPGQPVATVNGVELLTRDFQKQARYARINLINRYWSLAQLSQYFGNDPQFTSQFNQVTAMLTSGFALGRDTLDQMIEAELVRQEAARRGLSVSPAEVDQEIQDTFRFYPNGTPTPAPTLTPGPTSTEAPTGTPAPTGTGAPTATATRTVTPTETATAAPTETATEGPTPTVTPVPSVTPTATPYTQELFDRDFNDFVRQYQAEAGMTEADLRRQFEDQALRRKLSEVWEATPETASVRARHILVADEATAKDLIAQLQAGADFVDLARRYSTDASNNQFGGDLGFFQRGMMAPEFEAAAFDNPVGLVPAPVQTSFGWHVIEVLEKQAETPAEASARAFNDWLTEQRNDPNAVQTFDYWEDRVPDDPPFNPNIPPTPFPTSAP